MIVRKPVASAGDLGSGGVPTSVGWLACTGVATTGCAASSDTEACAAAAVSGAGCSVVVGLFSSAAAVGVSSAMTYTSASEADEADEAETS